MVVVCHYIQSVLMSVAISERFGKWLGIVWGGVISTCSDPRFEFRAVDEDESAGGSRGVVAELAVTDAGTGLQSLIPLTLKLTDFGLAQGLALDTSHVSVKNPAGTLKYDFFCVVHAARPPCRPLFGHDPS